MVSGNVRGKKKAVSGAGIVLPSCFAKPVNRMFKIRTVEATMPIAENLDKTSSFCSNTVGDITAAETSVHFITLQLQTETETAKMRH